MAQASDDATVDELLRLAHGLGREDRRLALLGEGNVSAALGDGRLLVKASGSKLATLDAAGLTACAAAPLLGLLGRDVSDAESLAALEAARADPDAGRPSVEASFHAHLLTLPNVGFVAHAHPEATLAILCSDAAEAFAARPLFPDQVVVCGATMPLVGYVDPGPALATAIAEAVAEHADPKVILLRNHGVITLGPTADAALAAMLMCEKAARVFAAAHSLGGARPMAEADVARIDGREDEAYRRRALNL